MSVTRARSNGRSHRAASHFPRLDPVVPTVETQVGQRITVDEATGCWLYLGIAEEYGQVRFSGGGKMLAHRFVYETLVGAIPEGLELHHTCETPGCCNPEHLTPLTHAEHMAEHRASA